MLKDRALEQQQQVRVLEERAAMSDQLELEAEEGEERAQASQEDAQVGTWEGRGITATE